MSISIDKIDILMERAQVGYKEAKEVLEKFEGNVVEALIYLEGEEKTSTDSKFRSSDGRAQIKEEFHKTRTSFMTKIRSALVSLHKTKFVMTKGEQTLLNLPMTIAIILTLMTIPFSLILLALGILTGYKIAVVKPNGKNIKASEALQFVERQQEKFKDDTKDDE
jgi:hypothetical protein